MAENQEKKEIIDSLRGRVTSDQAEKVAFTIQTTIELLEKTDPKSLKLKELKNLKKRLIGLGKSILEARTLENKNNSLVGKQMLGGTVMDGLTRKEREKIDSVQREIDKIVKKLGILLDSKVDTSALKKEIERKRGIVDYLKANSEFLPKDKQKLNLSILPIEELEALRNDFAGKVEVLKVIRAGANFLPFSERVFDLASTSTAKLNELVAKIEANKKTFEKFKAIDVFSSLTEKSLLVYFYKYLENKAKPAIETLVEVFNDMKKKAEEYRLAQEKVLAETKKITEIEARIAKKQGQRFEMPSFETMSSLMKERNDSILKSDFLEIFAKLLNDPATEIKKYLASFDEAIEDQKTSLVRLTMNEVAVVGQEILVDGYIDLDKLSTIYSVECRVTEEFPSRDTSRLKALGEQLKAKQAALLATNIGLLAKMIANLKFDEWLLGKTYNKMVKLAPGPEEKRNLFVEFESMKAGIKTRINSFLDQITDISFALKTAKDEETLRAELASGKELSPGSKAFAKRKADFLGKKLKRLDADFALADANSDIKRLGVIDDQKIALGFEKKVLEGKFSFEEALDIYWRLKATNPGLAENVKFYLESLGLKEMQKNIFENVDKGAVRFENDFASYFGGFPGKAIMNGTINVEYLESVQPKAAELIDTLESNGYFLSDLKKARTSIGKVLKKLEGVGLENSSLYTSLTRASELYLNLESRYTSTNDSDTYKFLNFVINDAVPETELFKPASWGYALEAYGKVALPIIIGATIAAVLVIALGPASIPAYILGAAGGAVGQEAFKPLVGLESDFSPGNLAVNFATSALSSFAVIKGAGVVFSSLSKAARAGRLGRVGKTVLKLAGKAANPASLRSPVTNLAHRLVSEPIQEVEEDFAQQFHPVLGALASFANAADGMNLDTSNLSVEAARVVSTFKASDATFLTSTDTSVILEVDANKVDALLGQLKTLDGRILTTKADGSIVFAFKAGSSSTSEVTLEFRPSNESSAVRNLMSSDMGLALQTDFGMALSQDGSYAYGKGKSKALKNKLENNGFVVQVAGDVVIAQKGDMQLTFKPKSLVSGTNISTMENTRLQTVEAAEPGRMAEIRAGSTMGSQAVSLLRTDVGDLWANMRSSLGDTAGKTPDAMTKADAKIAAQVKTALDNRGLPADFLAGISPSEQLQVLSDVATMQAEANLAGDNKQFGDAVERAKPGEDAWVDESVGNKFLDPGNLVQLLENNTDGLGVYRFALLISGQKIMPAFSYDQVLKINGVDQGLATVIIEETMKSDPDRFNAIRSEFYQDLVSQFGGESGFNSLFAEFKKDPSIESLNKFFLSKMTGAAAGLFIAFAPSTVYAADDSFIDFSSATTWIKIGVISLAVVAASKIGLFGGGRRGSLLGRVGSGIGSGAGSLARGTLDTATFWWRRRITRTTVDHQINNATGRGIPAPVENNLGIMPRAIEDSVLRPGRRDHAEIQAAYTNLTILRGAVASLITRLNRGDSIALPGEVLNNAALTSIFDMLINLSTATDANAAIRDLLALNTLMQTRSGGDGSLTFLQILQSPNRLTGGQIARTAIFVAMLAAALGIGSYYLLKDKEPEPSAPPTTADAAKAESDADRAKDQIGTSWDREEALEGGIPDRVDDPVKILRNNVSDCASQYPTKIPAPIKVISEKFAAGDDTNRALLEKLYISSVLSSLESGRPIHENSPKWMSTDMYLQGRFLQDCHGICYKKDKVQFSEAFYKKFDEMKYTMKGANKNPEFTKLQTDEERVEYYTNLVNETAELLITALR